MSAPEKIALARLSRRALEALTERLLAENAALQQAIAELRAEVAQLKGVKGRPKIKPSGLDKRTEAKPAEKGRGARGGCCSMSSSCSVPAAFGHKLGWLKILILLRTASHTLPC
jgi:hypothetical protein